MQKSGYAGAREISKEIEHLYGFQKTAPDHLDPHTWQTVLDVFVKDTYELGLQRFFEEQNPHARQTVLARLLEIDRQGIQPFSSQDRKMLLTEYARSVAVNGAACNAQVCGNAVLREYVAHELRHDGEIVQAEKMLSAFRSTLTKKVAPIAAKRRPAPLARPVEWRTLTDYALAWAKPFRVDWNVRSVPWWAWVGSLWAYVAVGLFARTRRKSRIDALSLSGWR